MTDLVLQSDLPNPPWLDPARWRLPGVLPLPLEDWLIRDEVFADQMALRDKLIATQFDSVHALLPGARLAAQECYDVVLDLLQRDPVYRFDDSMCTRPDGVRVPLDRDAPLRTLGRLVQADICLMEPSAAGHILTGAILCFPAYWTLSEKIGRPMHSIHKPVPEYNQNVGRRVQRLFDAIRPERPLWRMNANLHRSGELFTPKLEGAQDSRSDLEEGAFVRSERQVLRKLPKTGATVFSIHTYMVRVTDLSREARSKLYMLVPSSDGQ